MALLLLHSDAEAEGLPPIDEEEYLDMEEQRAPLLEDRRTSSEPSLKRAPWRGKKGAPWWMRREDEN